MVAKDEAAAASMSERTWYRRHGPNARPARPEGRPRRIPRQAFPAVYAAVQSGARTLTSVLSEFELSDRTWDRYVKELERHTADAT